jgi:hypothetical protein
MMSRGRTPSSLEKNAPPPEGGGSHITKTEVIIQQMCRLPAGKRLMGN